MEGESQAYNIDLLQERVPSTVIISVLFVFGLFGNSTYLFLMINADKMLTNIRYFSVALSIIDLIGIISGSILGILQNTYVVTFQSDFACKTLLYISSCAALLSSFVIALMAIDRYRLYCRPLSRQLTKKKQSIAILLLSCLVCLINIPILLLNGKRRINLTRQSIIVTNVTEFTTTREIDVESFLPTNVTTWSSLGDTNKTNVSPISDKTRFSSNNETFVTSFSFCALDFENHHLRVLKVVYYITVFVTITASLLTVFYAYTNIVMVMLRRGRRRRLLSKIDKIDPKEYSDNSKPPFKKKNSMDIDVSIHHTGLHCLDGLCSPGLQGEISENSDECAYNIPIKAISQKGRFMPKPETDFCRCCLPFSKLNARDFNRVQNCLKNYITIITLFVMSYMPSFISTLFRDRNLYLILSRSYLLAHALNPYVTIYFDNDIRRRLVELVSRLCRE